jgi:hypothetical protein
MGFSGAKETLPPGTELKISMTAGILERSGPFRGPLPPIRSLSHYDMESEWAGIMPRYSLVVRPRRQPRPIFNDVASSSWTAYNTPLEKILQSLTRVATSFLPAALRASVLRRQLGDLGEVTS